MYIVKLIIGKEAESYYMKYDDFFGLWNVQKTANVNNVSDMMEVQHLKYIDAQKTLTATEKNLLNSAHGKTYEIQIFSNDGQEDPRIWKSKFKTIYREIEDLLTI